MCPDGFKKIKGDIENIPCATASFDAVMALYVLGHSDIEAAMPELIRVLKPGGVLFIYDLHAGRYLPELGYMANYFYGVQPEGLNTDSFSKFMPGFEKKFPDVKPVIVRMVKH